MDKHQKALIIEDHEVIAGALLEFHQGMELLERSKLLAMKPKKEIVAQLKKAVADLKKQAKKAGKWTKPIFDQEIASMERQLATVVAEGVPRYAQNMSGVGKAGAKPKMNKAKAKLKLKDLYAKRATTGGHTRRARLQDQIDALEKEYGLKEDAVIDKLAKIIKANGNALFGMDDALKKLAGKKNVSYSDVQFPVYQLKIRGKKYAIVNKKYVDGPDKVVGDIAIGLMENVITEDAVSVGAGTIPTGPESVAGPDFKFRGHAGFDCDGGTFSKCVNGKKKYKRWNVFLNRDDELVGKVKNYMGQSYKNTNFVLRNKNTGEMTMGRRK